MDRLIPGLCCSREIVRRDLNEPRQILWLSPPGRSKRGFTLVEILVAAAVTVVMLGIMSQLFWGTLQATSLSRNQMESTQRTRLVLDSLTADLDNLVRIGDSGVYVETVGSTPVLAFLVRSRGPSTAVDFRMLAVSYRLDGDRLIRASSPVSWSDLDLEAAALDGASASATDTVVSESVLAFTISVLLSDGSRSPVTTNGDWKTSLGGNFAALRLGMDADSAGIPYVRGLVFSVASLDARSSDLPGVEVLAGQLANIVRAANETPGEAWERALQDGELGAGVPKPAISALRIAEMTWQFK